MEFDVVPFLWPCLIMKRGEEKKEKSDVCENGNGEDIWRKRGERKRKLHSEREGHRTAESWVGGRNRGEVPRQAWVSAWVEICESPSSSAHCNPETETRRRSASVRVHERGRGRERKDSTTPQQTDSCYFSQQSNIRDTDFYQLDFFSCKCLGR